MGSTYVDSGESPIDEDDAHMRHFDWARLADSEFEHLCRELLFRRGFNNVIRMAGPGSGDSRIDLHAEEFLVSRTGQSIPTKVLVQCKNYGGSRTTISGEEVEKIALRAKTQNYNRVLIITSYDLSAPAKNIAQKINNDSGWGVNIQWWTEHELVDGLFEYPDLRSRFDLTPTSQFKAEIAVLSGYISDKSHMCEPVFSRVLPDEWKKLLESKNVTVSLIAPAGIGTTYDAVVNPFGEVYPEEEPESRKTYQRIVEYVDHGGVFVNTAGFPFFYYWDGIGGRRIATEPSGKIVRKGDVLDFFSWSDTSFYRDFKQTVDNGEPREVTVFQMQEDRRYVGDLLSLGTRKVRQFRSLTSRGDAIPLLRAENEEIYPIAAVEHGYGHLIVAGLDLYQTEAPLVALAIKNWILTSGGSLPLKK